MSCIGLFLYLSRMLVRMLDDYMLMKLMCIERGRVDQYRHKLQKSNVSLDVGINDVEVGLNEVHHHLEHLSFCRFLAA